MPQSRDSILPVRLRRLLLLPLSLSARVYAGILTVVFATAFYFSYSWYAQQRLGRIVHEILYKRMIIMHTADRIKESMLSDQVALWHYAATRDPSDLQELRGVGQATIKEIEALRQATTRTEILQKLDLLQPEVLLYLAESRKLVGVVDAQKLPPKAGLLKAARWARERTQALETLDSASTESRARLDQTNALCDDVINLNQRALEEAQQNMTQTLAAGARDARLAGILVGLILLLLAIGHLRSILGPLQALITGIKRVEGGDLNFEIPVARQDEIGNLTRFFNWMTHRIQEQREQLIQLTITDGLTGLYNQRHFRVILKQEMDRARRAKTPLSLLMIDVDHFKDYNDSHGHEEGNELLKNIATILEETLREIDSVARYGGDELSVVLPNASSQEARVLAGRIEKAITDSQTQIMAGEPLPKGRVTLSMGGATFSGNASSLTDLILRADEALYAAKEAGRGCIRWADDRPVN